MVLTAAARFWTASLGGVIVIASVLAILSSLIGLLLSFHHSLRSGPTIILVAGVLYALSLMFGSVGGFVAQTLPRRYFET